RKHARYAVPPAARCRSRMRAADCSSVRYPAAARAVSWRGPLRTGRAVSSRRGSLRSHIDTYISPSAALSNQPAHLFSDLLVHRMGIRLADGITQGAAGPDEFRTAPLWGVGQRILFLHDGRTSDLIQAILDHASPGSEANQVVRSFQALSASD